MWIFYEQLFPFLTRKNQEKNQANQWLSPRQQIVQPSPFTELDVGELGRMHDGPAQGTERAFGETVPRNTNSALGPRRKPRSSTMKVQVPDLGLLLKRARPQMLKQLTTYLGPLIGGAQRMKLSLYLVQLTGGVRELISPKSWVMDNETEEAQDIRMTTCATDLQSLLPTHFKWSP